MHTPAVMSLPSLSGRSAPVPLCTFAVEIEDGLVLVTALVNGQEATLILDTGSTLTSLDTAFASRAAVAFRDGAARAHGGGTNAVSVALAVTDNLSVGSVTMQNHMVAVMPFDGISRAVGRNVCGTLGFDLFERYVVRVDYAAATVSLYDPADFTHEGGVEIPVRLDMRLPTTVVNATLSDGETVSARLVLDMGTSGVAAQFAPAFVRAHDMVRRSNRVLRAPVGTGIGGVSMGRFTRLPSLCIGGIDIEGPVVGLWQDDSPLPFDGTIGSAILDRTVLIIDYARQRVIVESSAGVSVKRPFFDASGLLLTRDEHTGATIVQYVSDDSPAAVAGIVPGSELLALDGCDARTMTLSAMRRVLSVPDATRRLTIRHAGETRLLDVLLRALL